MEKNALGQSGPTGIYETGVKSSAIDRLGEHLPDSLVRGYEDMSRVMFELDRLKRQSERLDLINKLHSRLASMLSVSGMIEAYSVWLMPIVEHELIGYNNYSRNKKYLYCCGHGPSRRRAIAFAEKLIEGGVEAGNVVTNSEGQRGHKWIYETEDNTSILLILKQDNTAVRAEQQVIDDSLIIFAESLQRGIEYEDVFEQASTDPLTGLSNRRFFDERITLMMNTATRYGSPLTMIALDLDHFKQINDNLGHQVGDKVLKSVAGVLKAAVRSTDLLVRMGGDEFTIVLDNTGLNQARVLAERLVKKIDELDVWAKNQLKLGASIGLAQLKRNESLPDWMDRTDDLLYHAKIGGRSRVASY